MAKGPLVSVTLKKSRETKGTHVFKDESDNAIIPSLYIRKDGIKGDAPDAVKVTVEAA